MAAKPSSPASDLVELVTCSICLENFKDARALPCLHSYCKECLQGLVTPQAKLTCPHCRLEVDVPNGDVSNLNSNFFVTNVLDVLNNDPSSLDVLTKDSIDSCIWCKDHPEKECELFCQQCSQLICYKCISNWGTCGQHAYESIDTTSKMYRQNVEDYLEEKERVLPSIVKHVVALSDMREKHSKSLLGVSKQISDTFALHIVSLKTREDVLTKQVFDMQWQNDDVFTSEIDRVKLEQAKVENTMELCRNMLDAGDPALFLQKFSKVKDQMFQTDSQELVSQIDLAPLRFQASDALLTDVISNFGNLMTSEEAHAVQEEKLSIAEGPSTSKQRGSTSGKKAAMSKRPDYGERANVKQPAENGPANVHCNANGHSKAQGANAQPVSWKFHNKNWGVSNVVFTDGRLTATTVNRNTGAIIGKPGFQEGKHSWTVKVKGFSNGLTIGVCVGAMGRGIAVTYESGLGRFGLQAQIHVDLDCDAKILTVKLNDNQREVLRFENAANSEVHPYFYLHGSDPSQCNKISIVSMDGKVVENSWSCCIL